MYLQTFSLEYFRNYERLELEFDIEYRLGSKFESKLKSKLKSKLGSKLEKAPAIHCIWGPNGAGKTNMLDAIHYLCTGKSAVSHTEKPLLKKGAPHFSIRGVMYKQDKTYHIHSAYAPSLRKVIHVDQEVFKKRSSFLGLFPVLMISAQDTRMIHEGSESRRRFFDRFIAHSDKDYLRTLLSYNHYLKRRNALLKGYLQHRRLDEVLVDTYDERLIALSASLSEMRTRFMKRYTPLFMETYAWLSEAKEQPAIRYRSDVLETAWPLNYTRARAEDLRMGHTRIGIHRDDYLFDLEDSPLRAYGSQGQQKTFVLALALTYYEMLWKERSFFPILLLDDMFDKLDHTRVQKLLALISAPAKGDMEGLPRQVFITSPEKEPLCAHLEKHACRVHFIHVAEGVAQAEKA